MDRICSQNRSEAALQNANRFVVQPALENIEFDELLERGFGEQPHGRRAKAVAGKIEPTQSAPGTGQGADAIQAGRGAVQQQHFAPGGRSRFDAFPATG